MRTGFCLDDSERGVKVGPVRSRMAPHGVVVGAAYRDDPSTGPGPDCSLVLDASILLLVAHDPRLIPRVHASCSGQRPEEDARDRDRFVVESRALG